MSGRPLPQSLRATRVTLLSSRRACLLTCLMGAAICVAQCLGLVLRVRSAGLGEAPSLGDVWTGVMGGASQPFPFGSELTATRPIIIPFGWLSMVLLPCVLTMRMFREDGYSDACLVAVGSRGSFWVGTAMGCLVVVLLYWSVIVSCCAVVTIACGGKLALDASPWLPTVIALERASLSDPPYHLGASVALAPAVSCAICLGQLALSLLVGPRASFLGSVALVSGSIFAMTPLLPGNLMMAARSTTYTVAYPVLVEGGVLLPGIEYRDFLLPAIAFCLSFFLLPIAVVSRRDYLGGSRS